MRVLWYFLIAVSSLTLSSCVTDRLAFWGIDEAQKHYIVTGINNNQNLQEYIETIVNDRASQKMVDEASLRRDILNALRSRGFYDAKVNYKSGEIGEYDVDAGKVLRIANIYIQPKSYSKYLENLEISQNAPLDASIVLGAQKELYKILQKENCSFALEVGHKIILNPTTKNADLYFSIEQGREAVFGAVSFSGNSAVKDSYLNKLITWKEGECFRHDKIEKFRGRLLTTGLFNNVDIIFPDEVDDTSSVPIGIVLDKKARRSVSAGVSYYSDEGIGAVFGWEHRNLLGSAENFNAALTLSLIEQSLKTRLEKPYFIRKDQSLIIDAYLALKDSDAYEELVLGSGFSIKRSLGKYLSANIGADIEVTRIDDGNADTNTFGLASPHASLSYDNRDDKLDPHKGWLLYSSIQPFIDAFGKSSPFIKSQASALTYFEAHKNLVLAARVKIGTIAGTSTDDIPATQRFYAGGGGSVRGFGYQEVGPFDGGYPLGGRSLFESSVEARFKLTNKLGAVAFIDAGQVADNVMPSFDSISVGAGLGFRYYTNFGPLRFDVGTPLSKKDNTDQSYQIYISIGQAF